MNQKLLRLRRVMAEYVPDSPPSVASSETYPWSPLPPLEEEEDVLVPIWDILHEDLFRQEREVREVWSLAEQLLRDYWHNQHFILRN